MAPEDAADTVRLLPATLDGARLASDLETRARPEEPSDPARRRHLLEHPWMGPVHLFLVQRGENLVGTAQHYHPDGAAWEPERVTHLELALVPEARDLAPHVLRLIEERAVADGPRRLLAWTMDGENDEERALRASGYEHVRTDISQDLDLDTNRERLLGMRADTRQRMAAQGIALRTAAEEPKVRFLGQLRDLTNATQRDIPHTVEQPDLDEEAFVSTTGAPGFHLDRCWAAWDGERLIAVSYLDFPLERGNVWTAYTACDREYRGRGIAQAIKNESVGQAIELGIPRIRTGNDSENEPMLAINRKLGYVPVFALREWLKTL